MPSLEAPKEIGEIPGISEENAQQLENHEDLEGAFLAPEKPKKRLVIILKPPKNTISMDMMDCLERIGAEANIVWTCIAQSKERRIRSRYPEVTDLFQREPDSEPRRHPIV